jgi:hypothetical protein
MRHQNIPQVSLVPDVPTTASASRRIDRRSRRPSLRYPRPPVVSDLRSISGV